MNQFSNMLRRRRPGGGLSRGWQNPYKEGLQPSIGSTWTRTVAPAVAPAIVQAPGARNWKLSNTTQLRAGVADVKSGTANARVLVLADSWGAGYGAGGSANGANARAFAWPTKLAQALSAVSIPASSDYTVGDGDEQSDAIANLMAYDSRLSHTGASVLAGYSCLGGATGGMVSCSGSTNGFTFTPGGTFNQVVLMFASNTTTQGDFDVLADGVFVTTIENSSIIGVGKVTINVPNGTAAVKLRPKTGFFNNIMIGARNANARKVEVINGCASGASLQKLARAPVVGSVSAETWNTRATLPVLLDSSVKNTVLITGGWYNDRSAGQTLAQAKASLSTLITDCLALGADVIYATYPKLDPALISDSEFRAWADGMMDTALSFDLPVFDMSAVISNYSAGVSAGYYYDSLHLSAAGHVICAQAWKACVSSVTNNIAAPTLGPNILLDTDMSSDVDDLMDVKACTIYHNEGMANVIGIAVTTSRDVSPGAVRAATTYWGQKNIPVASYAPLGTFDPGAPSTNYLNALYGNAYHDGIRLASTAVDTTTAIGQWLTASSGDVTYIMTGFAKGLRAFLSASSANMTLFAAKVKTVVASAGLYPNSGNAPEFNIQQNADDWLWLNANCPSPIIWCGIELGNAMGEVGGSYLDARQGTHDMMVMSLESYGGKRIPWGVIGVVYAVNPTPFNYGLVSGMNAINGSTGANTFTAGSGPQKYLTLTPENRALVKAHIETIVAADGANGTKTWDGNVWLDEGEVTPTNIHGYNVGRANYYSSGYPTIDRMKFCGGFASGSGYTFDDDGWFTIAPGGNVQVNVVLSLGPVGWFPPGNYKVTSATGVTIIVNSADGLSNISAAAQNLVTFTAGTPSDWSNFRLTLSLGNQTGAPIRVNDVKVFLASQEALLQSGEIFDPDWLAAHAGTKVMRFKDWQFQDEAEAGAQIRTFADFGSQNEGKLSYGPGYRCPISIMIKAAKKLGCAAWFSMPTGSFNSVVASEATGPGGSTVFRAYRTDSFFGLIERDPHLPNGTRVRLNTENLSAGWAPLQTKHDYWTVNASGSTFQIAATPGGAPITLTIPASTVEQLGYQPFSAHTNRDPENDIWKPLMQAAYNTDPSVPIWCEYGNEVWNIGYENWRFTKDVATDLAGASIAYIGIGYAYMSLKAWRAAESVYSADLSKVTRVFACQTAGGLSAFAQGPGFIDPGFISAGKTVSEILVASKDRAVYACAPYFSQDDGAGHYFPNGFTCAAAYAKNGNSTNYSDAFWRQTLVGDLEGVNGYGGVGIAGAKVWMDQTRDDAKANFPGVPIVFYEWGHQCVMPAGGASPEVTYATALSLYNYFNSEAGKDVYKYAYEQLIAPYKVRVVAHYWSIGGATVSEGGFSMWPLQNTPVDNPRSNYFRSL